MPSVAAMDLHASQDPAKSRSFATLNAAGDAREQRPPGRALIAHSVILKARTECHDALKRAPRFSWRDAHSTQNAPAERICSAGAQ